VKSEDKVNAITAKENKTSNKKEEFPSSIEALKSDLYESSSKIVQGNLGVMKNYDEWISSLTAVNSATEIVGFIIIIIVAVVIVKYIVEELPGLHGLNFNTLYTIHFDFGSRHSFLLITTFLFT